MNPTDRQKTVEAIVERTWEGLHTESVGASELGLIQQALKDSLGPQALVSPAQIARILVDLGAQLRHPEILNTDFAWRQTQLDSLFESLENDFGTIAAAIKSMDRLNERRLRFVESEDVSGIQNLREYVLEIRSDLIEWPSPVAPEVVEWLTLWLQNPEIFCDWLSLRVRSSEFVSKFGEIN